MSARPKRSRSHEEQRARLGPLPRPLSLVVLVAWALLSIAAIVALLSRPLPWSGELDGLVPSEQRLDRDRPLALLRVDLDALAALDEAEAGTDEGAEEATKDPRTILAEAGFAIEEALGEARVPLAPPRTEITRWLDAHALYLLPLDTHAALTERLSDEAMLAQVQGLTARLSSPLFSVSGEQPRRDPLALHELTEREAGRLGHVAEIPGSNTPQVGPSGDLIAATGDRALVGLSSVRPASELRDEIEAALESLELPVEVEIIARSDHQARVASALAGDWTKAMIACFAGLCLLLSVVLRRVVSVLTLVVCLASTWALLIWAATSLKLDGVGSLGGLELDLASVALSIVLLGFACDAALRLQNIGGRERGRGWIAPLMLAGALAPLWLSPYPLWQRWALWWALAYLLAALIMRVVFPVLLELLGGDVDWRRPGFRLTPTPLLAALLCLGLCGAGAWLAPQLDYRSPARIPIANAELQELERELSEHFFDPSMVVEARSMAPAPEDRPPELETSAAAALDAAAGTVAALAELVPGEARRVDSPGSFVLPHAELEARKQALAQLELESRMETLKLLLGDRGLRPEAFAEFLDGAADIDDLPSAQAALDGSLGPWISGYLVGGDGDSVELRGRDGLRSWVELRGRDGLPSATLSDARLAELPALRGPAIAAMIDQREFHRRLGLVVIAGLWLTAFLAWAGTGSLAIGLAVAAVTLATESGVMIALSLLDARLGPHLLPVILVVGTAAGVAGGRACRAVSLGQPIVARGLLLAGGCQIIAAGVLATSSQPLWQELGVAVALGSALACGLGLFATPGLALLFGAPGRRRPRASEAPKPDESPDEPKEPDEPDEPKPEDEP